ncbi:hypothetical protein C1645_827288 [Glomus cerebriforme]|uniref:Uncharacterized protein n=1 Tax=Glomus cerebriforme TaxID=658196 RepID=A0A397SS79_9GLOM|nr:hypothetical protein C1645_827288 [Glomus cerebriforme]
MSPYAILTWDSDADSSWTNGSSFDNAQKIANFYINQKLSKKYHNQDLLLLKAYIIISEEDYKIIEQNHKETSNKIKRKKYEHQKQIELLER